MSEQVRLEAPTAANGYAVNQLVKACEPLDPNSIYCNLLQCTHFADTSIAAFLGEELVGFISGYKIPERSNTLFIWQVAVSSAARGQGLARKMLQGILDRPCCEDVCYLETTITPGNQASWSLFKSLANKLDADLNEAEGFNSEVHFNSQHDSEMLVRIGPFNR